MALGSGLHPFHGCHAKLLRANEHVSALKEIIDSLGPHPYRIVEERNPQTGDRDFRLIGGADLPTFRRRIPMLPVIVGDVIHQIRSSLDHAVWQIAKPPIEKRTAFPICINDSAAGRPFTAPAEMPESASAISRTFRCSPLSASSRSSHTTDLGSGMNCG